MLSRTDAGGHASGHLGYADLEEEKEEEVVVMEEQLQNKNRLLRAARVAAFNTMADASRSKKGVTFTTSLPTLVPRPGITDYVVGPVQRKDQPFVTESLLGWPRYLTSHAYDSRWPRAAANLWTKQQSSGPEQHSRFADGAAYRDVSVAPNHVGSGWYYAAPRHRGGRAAADMLIAQTLAAEAFVDSLVESYLAKEVTAVVKETLRSIVWDHVEARPLNEFFGRLVDEIIRETVLSTLTTPEPPSLRHHRRNTVKDEVSSLSAGLFMDTLQVEYFLALLSGHTEECDGFQSNQRDFAETFMDSMILEVLLMEAIHLTDT